jgi:hypothetical protein
MTSFRSSGFDIRGPHIKTVWHSVIILDTVAGEHLQEPQIARACSSTRCYSSQQRAKSK